MSEAAAQEIPASPGTDLPGPALRWTLRLLAAAGAAISGYLFVLGWTERSLPPGCGPGSGCAEVLTSRWAAVLGVPVSGPAMAVHLGVLAAALLVGPGHPPTRRAAAWRVLLVLATLLAGAAAWFVGLQIVLRAFCPWCMADHALGLMAAAIVCFAAPVGVEAAPGLLSRRANRRLIAVGVAGSVAFIAAQWAVPYRAPVALRLPAGKDADTGPGPDRALAVLDGALQLEPHREPTLGSPDAKVLLLLLYDYCCPHCRQTHAALVERLPRYGGQLGLVLLPMPRDADCNPHIQETEARFEHACELARLALAVWRADATKFAEFDRWLYEPELPREPEEARRYAESLVPAAALEAALADPALELLIRRNCDKHRRACELAQADRIPVLMAPGLATLVGRPSEEQLTEMLEEELGRAEGRADRSRHHGVELSD